MSNLKQAREAFKWTIYLRGLSQLTTWAISLFVIRFLTPIDYGIVAITEIVFMFMMLLCSAGLGDALIQKKEIDEIFIRKILNILLIIALILCSSLFFLAPLFAKYYNHEELSLVFRISAFIFLLTPWLVISSCLLARKMDFKSRGKVDLFAAVCSALLSLFLAYNGFGFWSLIVANLFNTTIRTIGYVKSLGKFYLPKYDLTEMLAPFKFGITVAMTSIVFVLFMKIDVLVIASQMDTQTLGYYALAMHLALLPMVKIMPLINEVAYPMYSSIRDNHIECERVFFYILRVVCFIMFPIFFIFSAISPKLVKFLLGDIWVPASYALQIILLTIPFRIISDLMTPLLKALGKPQTGLKHVSFSCAIVAIVFYFAAPYGLQGLAYGWLFATPLFLTYALTISTRSSKISLLDLVLTIMRPIATSVITLIIVNLVASKTSYELNIVVSIMLEIIVGLTSYILLSLAINKRQLLEVYKFRL